MRPDTPRINTMCFWDSRQPMQCSGTARVYDSGSYVLSGSEEQGTSPKMKKMSVIKMKGLSTQKEKNQDEKQPFGRDHENNVFLESFK